MMLKEGDSASSYYRGGVSIGCFAPYHATR